MTAEVETAAKDWLDTEELPTATVQLQAHYDGVRKAFWTTNDRGGWIEVNEQSLRRLLRAQGLRSGKPLNGERLTPLEQKLNEIQTQHDVAYAGPLAGYRSGLTECCGHRILVTTSPTLIHPIAGEWPVLGKYLDSLLFDNHYDQRQYVFAWLKIAYGALHEGLWRGGPAMALAGPRGCGKSLLQNLFTLILGGRSAKPYRYMSGGTQFNADLFGAEHLMIEDEHSSTDIRSRRAFGSNIKRFTSNHTQSCHGKNRQALTLTPFWRVSISVNDEPEAMMVLPPMSDSAHDSLGDKIILLNAQKAEMPLPTVENEEWQTFWRTLITELPAFLHFLVNWNIPNDLRHPRFGVQAWQHPRLLAALDALAPETRLLGLIDEEIFGVTEVGVGRTVPPSKWEGTAEKLERLLCDLNSPFSNEARRLLSWSSATGTYLGRLAHKHPDRVNPGRTSEARNWIIFRKPDSPPAVTP
jgi:hypothetical protein